MKNKQLIFGIVVLLVVAICAGLTIFFISNVVPKKSVDNSEQKALENVELETIVNNAEKVIAKDFNGDKAVEVVKEYINAVNSKDWATIAKYSTQSQIEDLIKYQISDMHYVTSSTNKVYTYNQENDEYVFNVDYSFKTQNEESIKDLGLGKLFIVKVQNDIITIAPFATGL